MARLPEGLDLATELTVADRAERVYGFDFPVAGAEQVQVALNGVALTGEQFSVVLRGDGSGGSVAFLTRTQTPNPVSLSVGDSVLITRDTPIRAEVDVLAGAQELAERPVVSRDDVAAIVRTLVADWAEAGNAGSIPSGKLSNATVAALDPVPAAIREALNIRSVDLVGADLVGVSDGGSTMSVDLIPAVRAGVADWAEFDSVAPIPRAKLTDAPGLTEGEVDGRVVSGVQTWAQQGNTDALPSSKLTNAPTGFRLYEEGGLLGRVTDLDVRGAELDATRVGATGTLTLTIPAVVPGLDQAQVDARIVALVQDWARGVEGARLPAGAVFSAFSDSGNVQFTQDNGEISAHVDLPDVTAHVDRDAAYSFNATTTGTVTENTGVIGTLTIDANDITFSAPRYDSNTRTFRLRISPIDRYTLLEAFRLDVVNAAGERTTLRFANVYDRQDGAGFREVTWREVPASTLTAGGCIVELYEPVRGINYVPSPGAADLEGWVLTLGSGKVPEWAVSTGGGGGGPSGGLTLAQVNARIAAVVPTLVQDWAETGNAGLIPASKLTNAPGQTQAQVDARIVAGVQAWARDETTAIPAAKLANSPVNLTVEDGGTVRGTAGGIDTLNFGTNLAVSVSGREATIRGVTGLTQAAVDARIVAGVPGWARNNTTKVPVAKLRDAVSIADAEAGISATLGAWSASLVHRAIRAVVPAWARTGDTGALPLAKLPVMAVGASEAVAGIAGTLRLWSATRIAALVDGRVNVWARDAGTQIPLSKLANAPGASGRFGKVRGVGVLPAAADYLAEDVWLSVGTPSRTDGLYERTGSPGTGNAELTLSSWTPAMWLVGSTRGEGRFDQFGFDFTGGDDGTVANRGTRPPGMPASVTSLILDSGRGADNRLRVTVDAGPVDGDEPEPESPLGTNLRIAFRAATTPTGRVRDRNSFGRTDGYSLSRTGPVSIRGRWIYTYQSISFGRNDFFRVTFTRIAATGAQPFSRTAGTEAWTLRVGGSGPVSVNAAGVSVAASGFDGNLATTDDTVQKVAQKVDDLTFAYATEGPEWARSVVLPSSGTYARGADLLSNTANQWTLAAGRPSQVSAFNNGLQVEAARWNKAVNGFWVAAFIGEEEQGAFQIGWGELLAPSTGATLVRNMALAVKETPAGRRNSGFSDSKFITIEFRLFTNGLLIIKPKYLNALPDANTTIRVYPSGVFAA